MLGDHGALITVQGDAGVVEGLLGVFEDIVELGDPSLEHRAEVTGDQRPADRCREREERTEMLNIERAKVKMWGEDGRTNCNSIRHCRRCNTTTITQLLLLLGLLLLVELLMLP